MIESESFAPPIRTRRGEDTVPYRGRCMERRPFPDATRRGGDTALYLWR